MLWTPLPSVPTPRDTSQAGFVTYPDGAKGVLVAGGSVTDSAEFLNLDTLIWEPKQSLPFDISYAASVPFKDSFLIVGGKSQDLGSDLRTVYYYNASVDDWQVMEETMRYERFALAAFLVPDYYANCE